jgi:hypothetical protein
VFFSDLYLSIYLSIYLSLSLSISLSLSHSLFLSLTHSLSFYLSIHLSLFNIQHTHMHEHLLHSLAHTAAFEAVCELSTCGADRLAHVFINFCATRMHTVHVRVCMLLFMYVGTGMQAASSGMSYIANCPGVCAVKYVCIMCKSVYTLRPCMHMCGILHIHARNMHMYAITCANMHTFNMLEKLSSKQTPASLPQVSLCWQACMSEAEKTSVSRRETRKPWVIKM